MKKYVHSDRLRRVPYCSYCNKQFDNFNRRWKAFLWAAVNVVFCHKSLVDKNDNSPEIKVVF